MSGVALATAVVGGVGAWETNRASNKMAEADKSATQVQLTEEMQALDQYNKALAKATPLYAPYLAPGTQATGTLAELMRPGGYLYNAPDMTNFRADPQYKNILNQAMEAIRSSRAGSGNLYSGQTDIDLEKAAANIADQAYQSIYSRKAGEQNTLASRLGGLSDMGRWATGNLTDLYTGYGRNAAGVFEHMGSDAASGIRAVGQDKASGMMGEWDAIMKALGLAMTAEGATPRSPSSSPSPSSPMSGGFGTYMNPGTLPTLSSYYGSNW